MASSISEYLNDIQNARYGEQVRSAIYNSILACYNDVTASETVAGSAAAATIAAIEAASSATAAAISATSAANAAASSATVATTSLTEAAENAIGAANDAASLATNAAETATTAATAATSAKDLAVTATAGANTAATGANTAKTEANAARDAALSAASSATSAASSAIAAASSATSAASTAISAIAAISEAVSNANAAIASIETARTDTVTATTTANTAASSIINMTVTSENVSPATSAAAIVTDVDGHKNIHFQLRQGEQGAPFRILGSAYSTVSDLEEAVTDPDEGDQYNVGASAPYNVYRWTGESWEDQGTFGDTISNVSDTEIDSMWTGTAISSGTSKYINHTGLFHLIYEKIVAALGNKVDKSGSKVLSDNNFSTTYKNQIDTNTAAITTLGTEKVSKVDGKGLSTNDFTTAYKNQVDANTAIIGSSAMSTTASTITGAINELKGAIGTGSIPASNVIASDDDSVQTHLTTIESTMSSHTSTISTLETSVATNTAAIGRISYSTFNKDNVELAAGTDTTVSIPISRTGYTPIGIIGYSISNASSSGANSSRCLAYRVHLVGTNANVAVRNTYTAKANIRVYVNVLYI